ncbi:hypothetical protein RND71_002324 [Anisodus tanguticus]|uniref:Uncharacterized protein n=1 Tax=Anisodus tanguticus TaxID=243964 RepID=A0AAE1T3L7_9SOLA|nr:hypothetical protein RND71_002324 [Anisodus tanguticus]
MSNECSKVSELIDEEMGNDIGMDDLLAQMCVSSGATGQLGALGKSATIHGKAHRGMFGPFQLFKGLLQITAEIGGWSQSFGGLREGKNVTCLTFATVRGAAHEVPYTSHSQALTHFFEHFLEDIRHREGTTPFEPISCITLSI